MQTEMQIGKVLFANYLKVLMNIQLLSNDVIGFDLNTLKIFEDLYFRICVLINFKLNKIFIQKEINSKPITFKQINLL